MSEIIGNGYSNKHNWKHLITHERREFPQGEYSDYQCTNCFHFFRHFYNVTPDIFKVMKIWEIPEECKKYEYR